MTDDRWLTYAGAATMLGMTAESVRQRARRERWAKRLNNEGKATVLVPVDAAASPGGDTGGDAAGVHPGARPSKAGVDTGIVHELQARVADLQADLARERGEHDRERRERLTERERADRIAGELAELSRRFEAAIGDGRAREEAIRVDLDEARRTLAEWRARPWWKRLAG